MKTYMYSRFYLSNIELFCNKICTTHFIQCLKNKNEHQSFKPMLNIECLCLGGALKKSLWMCSESN